MRADRFRGKPVVFMQQARYRAAPDSSSTAGWPWASRRRAPPVV